MRSRPLSAATPGCERFALGGGGGVSVGVGGVAIRAVRRGLNRTCSHAIGAASTALAPKKNRRRVPTAFLAPDARRPLRARATDTVGVACASLARFSLIARTSRLVRENFALSNRPRVPARARPSRSSASPSAPPVIARAAVVHRRRLMRIRAERAVARLLEPVPEIQLIADLHVRRRTLHSMRLPPLSVKMIHDSECGRRIEMAST